MTPPIRSLLRCLSMIHRISHARLRAELEAYGIGRGQMPFLMELVTLGHAKQEELASRLGFDKGTTARALAKLEAKGYIRRVPSAEDRRAKDVFPTAKARAVEGELRGIGRAWTEVLLDGLDAAEREAALDLLLHMAGNALRAMEGHRRASEAHGAPEVEEGAEAVPEGAARRGGTTR